jgi:hypothetical protein
MQNQATLPTGTEFAAGTCLAMAKASGTNLPRRIIHNRNNGDKEGPLKIDVENKWRQQNEHSDKYRNGGGSCGAIDIRIWVQFCGEIRRKYGKVVEGFTFRRTSVSELQQRLEIC